MSWSSHLWNAFMFGGTAFVVFGLGHSGWWFAIPLATMLIPKTRDNKG